MENKKYFVKARTQVLVWQEVQYEVEATSPEKAKELIKAKPLSLATGYDNLDGEDEKVIQIDFTNAGNGEEIIEV